MDDLSATRAELSLPSWQYGRQVVMCYNAIVFPSTRARRNQISDSRQASQCYTYHCIVSVHLHDTKVLVQGAGHVLAWQRHRRNEQHAKLNIETD